MLPANKYLLQWVDLFLLLIAGSHLICIEADLPSYACLASCIFVLDLADSFLNGLLSFVLLKLFLFGRVKSGANLLELLQ